MSEKKEILKDDKFSLKIIDNFYSWVIYLLGIVGHSKNTREMIKEDIRKKIVELKELKSVMEFGEKLNQEDNSCSFLNYCPFLKEKKRGYK